MEYKALLEAAAILTLHAAAIRDADAEKAARLDSVVEVFICVACELEAETPPQKVKLRLVQ